MGLSWWHILIVLVLFVLLFGRGKISDLMGDVAKGIKSFKAGMAEDEPMLNETKVVDQGETRESTIRPKAPRKHKSV